MRIAILLAVLLSPLFHWQRVSDAYRVHQRYVNHWAVPMGEYYQWRVDPSAYPPPAPAPFLAQCETGPVTSFATEPEARAFVLNCPRWN